MNCINLLLSFVLPVFLIDGVFGAENSGFASLESEFRASQSYEACLSELIAKEKDIVQKHLVENIMAHGMRYRELTLYLAAEKLFEKLFRSMGDMVSAEGWDPGWEILKEEASAHSDPEKKAESLVNLEKLVDVLNDLAKETSELEAKLEEDLTEKDAETLEQNREFFKTQLPKLQERKELAIRGKKDLVFAAILEISEAVKLMQKLITQVSAEFFLDSSRLVTLMTKNNASEGDISKWEAQKLDDFLREGDEELDVDESITTVELYERWLAHKKAVLQQEKNHSRDSISSMEAQKQSLENLRIEVGSMIDFANQDVSGAGDEFSEELQSIWADLIIEIGQLQGFVNRENLNSTRNVEVRGDPTK